MQKLQNKTLAILIAALLTISMAASIISFQKGMLIIFHLGHSQNDAYINIATGTQ